MNHSAQRIWALGAGMAAALALLAGCEQNGRPIVRADTFPMGTIDRFDQAMPSAPLFGKTDYLRERQVWPMARASVGEPLPPGVPLPVALAEINVIQPTAETAQPSEDQGGSSPASGMAQGITNAQGGGETNQHDGGKTNVPRE